VLPPSQGSDAADYREAVLQKNVLGKITDSTRQKSLRHLRELYAIDEATSILGSCAKLHAADAAQPACSRFRLHGRAIRYSSHFPAHHGRIGGRPVETASLAQALEAIFPNQYSELNRHKIARNAASSWTQSGHLVGRAKKTVAESTASRGRHHGLFPWGYRAGYHGRRSFPIRGVVSSISPLTAPEPWARRLIGPGC